MCLKLNPMNRRFFSWASLGFLASFLPSIIAACSQEKETTANNSQPKGFQSIGTLSELQSGPILVTKGLSAGPVLVVRNPADPNTPVAVNPTCPHAGCNVNWQANQTAFVCPCHDSRFDFSGKVLQGPADKPLTTYESKIEEDQVMVKQG